MRAGSLPDAEDGTRPRFIADAMLGGLARWLRAVGLDVAHDPRLDDAELVARAVREGRVILTRDRRLVRRRRARRWLLVGSVDVDEQVRQVISELDDEITDGDLFSRCLRCNRVLDRLAADEARPEVPEHIAATHEVFSRCPACERIYWRGTHVERMRRRIDRLGIV